MTIDSKVSQYKIIAAQAKAITEGESDLIANMANLSALLYNQLEELNWAGFYIFKQKQLVLGPFQGQIACVRIPMGQGVCGTAAQKKEAQVIGNVHEFDGHIACDAASNSEIVIPICKNGELIGVLDIDSPKYNRFDEQDLVGLTQIVDILVDTIR